MDKAKLVAGLASAFVLASAAPAAAQSLAPVGIWSLSESSGTVAHDTVFNHDPGTVQSGATSTQGRFQGSLAFDGNNGAVDVPNEPALEPANVTVSAWVNSATRPGNFRYVVVKGATGCIAGSYGMYTGANGGLEFYASSNGGLNYSVSPDAGTSVWDGKWHSVIGTFDSSTVRLYVDGKQVGSGTPDTSAITYGLSSSNDLMIGNYGGCSGLGFSGRIDEVKVFGRALGAQEISLAVQASQWVPSQLPGDLVL